MAFTGVGSTKGPYLSAMILSILVGACGPAIAVVATRVLKSLNDRGLRSD